MSIPFRPSSLVRALGTAHAVSAPPAGKVRLLASLAVVGGTEVAAQRLDRHGLAVMLITPGRGEEWSDERQLGADALRTGSWVGANLLLGALLRKIPLPRIVLGLLAGAGVYALDVKMVEKYESILASRQT